MAEQAKSWSSADFLEGVAEGALGVSSITRGFSSKGDTILGLQIVDVTPVVGELSPEDIKWALAERLALEFGCRLVSEEVNGQ